MSDREPKANLGGLDPEALLRAGLPDRDDEVEGLDRARLERAFPGLVFGELLGRGGMGIVWRARQKSLDRDVAVKILLPGIGAQPAFADRFAREARALARLDHPNIVRVHEAGETDGLYFLVMEYVDGVNLRQAMDGHALDPARALRIVPAICDALQYAHDRGVVHRDVKPENIMLGRDGRVRIADFGLAKLVGENPAGGTLTGAGQVMGTVHYIAPEQIRTPREVDHRADIYSLGVVFYEMLTGDLPLGRFPPPSEKVRVDLRIDEVVLRTLERERERRYQHVSEVRDGVDHVVSTPHAAPAPDAAPVVATPALPTRQLSRLAVAGVLGVPASMLTYALILGLGGRPDAAALAGFAVVIAGVVTSVVARSAIRVEPARWTGLGLARLGFWLPVGLAGMAILFFTFLLVSVDPPGAARRQAETRAVEAQVAAYLRQLSTTEAVSPADLVSMIDPALRETLSPAGAPLDGPAPAPGLSSLDRELLPAPFAAWSVASVQVDGDRADVEIRHGGSRIRFPMVRREGTWFFAAGEVDLKVEPESPR